MTIDCGNRCCGFLMRGFLMAGGMTASRGYGSCTGADIIFPEEDLFKTGTGLGTQISAVSPPPPTAAIRYLERRTVSACERLRKK